MQVKQYYINASKKKSIKYSQNIRIFYQVKGFQKNITG